MDKARRQQAYDHRLRRLAHETGYTSVALELEVTPANSPSSSTSRHSRRRAERAGRGERGRAGAGVGTGASPQGRPGKIRDYAAVRVSRSPLVSSY